MKILNMTPLLQSIPVWQSLLSSKLGILTGKIMKSPLLWHVKLDLVRGKNEILAVMQENWVFLIFIFSAKNNITIGHIISVK